MKKVLFVFAIITLLAVSCVAVVGCKTKPHENDPQIGSVNSVNVTDAMNEIYSSLEHSVTTDGATEGIYVGFSGYSKNIDSTLAVNEKPTVFDFASKIYIDSDNLTDDQKSTLTFVVKQENGATKLAVYYANGKLYVDYPPVFTKVAIDGLELANIVNNLNTSKIHGGKIKTVADLLPLLGNYVFTSCEKLVLGKCDDPNCNCKTHYKYTCTIDFSKLYSALEKVLSSAKLGITADMVLDVLNLTHADLNELSKLQTSFIFNTYVQRGDDNYYYFKSLEYNKVEGAITDTFAITSFSATEFTSQFASEYKVTLADNLSSYRAFNFANYDISGTLTLSTKSYNGLTEIFGEQVLAELVKNDFSCNYSFKSNYKDGTLTAYLTLGNIFGTDKEISLYYDGTTLYANLYAYLGKEGGNQGFLKFSDEYVKDKLKLLSVLKDTAEADTNDKIYLITSLLAGLTHTADSTTIELNKTSLDIISAVFGYDFVLDYDKAIINLNTESNLFKGIELNLVGEGATLSISASNPKVGYEVLVETPDWTGKCANWESLSRVTPVLSGTITTNLNNVSNTALVESLITSLSGETVELQGNISKFVFEANYTTTGKLEIFKINFLTEDNSLVCSLYYYTKGETRSNDLYVILPEVNGKTSVRQLKMIETGRYSGLLNTINGNALVVSGEPEVVISNNSTSIEVSANKGGASNVLAFIKKIFGDIYLTELPIDFAVNNMSLTLGEKLSIRSTFGSNKYIDLHIDNAVLDNYSLALKTTEINTHKDRTVSIFDDNDMVSVISLTLGGEKDTTLNFNVADFGGWQYENIPALGTGVNNVNAYLTVLGQKVTEVLKVDCSNADNYAVKVDMEYVDYVDNDNKIFTFDKYASSVDPIYVITAYFNSVDLQLGNKYINKPATWSYKDKPLEEATFGYGSTFTIIPAVKGFFEKDISLKTCSYSLNLSNTEIQGIENADNYLTIYAYANFDPFSPLTYQSVDPYVLTKDGERFKTNLEWDISSIKNVNIELNRKVLSNEELKEALANSFYSLSGNYKITVNIKNSLGFVSSFDVTITVADRIINNTTPLKLADGVEFESITDSELSGIFIIDPIKINQLNSDVSLAKEILVEYTGDKKTENTIKWELPIVNSVPLYSETPISGEMSVVIGDKVGGYQSFKYVYIFKTYNLTSISLISGESEVATEEKPTKETTFELLNKNPYAFDCPTQVVLNYGEYTLSYNDFSKTYEASNIVYKNVNWGMTNLVDSEVWHRGEENVYSGSFTVCDHKVVLNLSYIKAIADSWVFLDSNGNIANEVLPILTTPTYIEDSNGAFVFVNGRYILATAEHKNLTHFSIKANAEGKVYYKKADASEDILSLTLDPNKTDYLCYDSYPAMAKVTFAGIIDDNGNPIEYTLKLNWDLSELYNSTTIKSHGFYETVPVYIAHNQKLADVNLWISGEDPTDYYCYYDEESGVGSKSISVKIMGIDANGKLVLNDLSSIKTLHDLICDCNDSDCLGKIYFKYADQNTESGWFTITEWVGLDAISDLYKTQMALGVAVEEVSGIVTLTAKVGNILCSSISLSIEKSVISAPSFEKYLPYANSSVNNSVADVYSMHADGVKLTIDPYLANPKDSTNYPTRVSFYLDGAEVVADINSWDLSCFDGKEMYLGATGTVVALIETKFGNININAPATVIERQVELVVVDGSTLPVINVNVYSETPYGENVTTENGRTIAYKRIEVKFVNDDNFYPMTLKYDITGFEASHSGGVIAMDIDVFVGNEAGGYQKKSGYSVYSTQNVILSIVSNDESITDYIADGVIYSAEKGFTSFDGVDNNSMVLANIAWKQLLVNTETLTVNYSYYDLGKKVTNSLVFNKGANYNGFTFDLVRLSNGTVALNIWNNGKAIGGVGAVQSLSTGSNKKIKLYDIDFTLNSLATDLVYDPSLTVSSYLAKYKVYSIPQTMIAENSIVLELLDEKDNVLSTDTHLTVGTYKVRLTVIDDNFQTVVITNDGEVLSPLTKQIKVDQHEVSEITIVNGDREIYKTINVYEVYEGASIALNASVKEGFKVIITITNADGEVVTEPEQVGTYTITFTSSDSNYLLNVGEYTLTIKPRTVEE